MPVNKNKAELLLFPRDNVQLLFLHTEELPSYFFFKVLLKIYLHFYSVIHMTFNVYIYKV